jgi:hypothetical protein
MAVQFDSEGDRIGMQFSEFAGRFHADRSHPFLVYDLNYSVQFRSGFARNAPPATS